MRTLEPTDSEARTLVGMELGQGSRLTISLYDEMEATDRAMSNRAKYSG